MKTPKRQMPQRPRCPICGHPLFIEWDNEEGYTTSYLICANEDCELTDIITQEEYAELKKQVEDYEYKTSEVYHDNGEHKLEARWKRKNREAQYKRTIARLKQELAKTKQDLYVCESCIEVYESAAEGEKWNAAIWKKEATALVARFGQDIEGS